MDKNKINTNIIIENNKEKKLEGNASLEKELITQEDNTQDVNKNSDNNISNSNNDKNYDFIEKKENLNEQQYINKPLSDLNIINNENNSLNNKKELIPKESAKSLETNITLNESKETDNRSNKNNENNQIIKNKINTEENYLKSEDNKLKEKPQNKKINNKRKRTKTRRKNICYYLCYNCYEDSEDNGNGKNGCCHNCCKKISICFDNCCKCNNCGDCHCIKCNCSTGCREICCSSIYVGCCNLCIIY